MCESILYSFTFLKAIICQKRWVAASEAKPLGMAEPDLIGGKLRLTLPPIDLRLSIENLP